MHISLIHHLRDSLDRYREEQLQKKGVGMLPNLSDLSYLHTESIDNTS